MWSGRSSETRYRVDEFRRFLPRTGSSGKGLVQFWGPRAVRRDDGWNTPLGPWEIGPEEQLHTIDVGDPDLVVKDPK